MVCAICGKGTRAVWYCRRGDCGLRVRMADLPRPEVEVNERITEIGPQVDIVISRDGKAKSYTGIGASRDKAVADGVKRLLDDPYTAEWLPGKKLG